MCSFVYNWKIFGGALVVDQLNWIQLWASLLFRLQPAMRAAKANKAEMY